MKLARVLGAVGRTLITAGALILLFVAYQLWGTGIRQGQAQDRLRDQFDDTLEQAQGPASTLPPNPADPLPEGIPEGEPVGYIDIPKMGLGPREVIVEGVSTNDLKKGPGHYPDTPLPGQLGNSGIAGHRTTYGAPFAEIDKLVPGDTIKITTVQGNFTYAVIDPCPADHPVEGCEAGSGTLIVAPKQSEVLNGLTQTNPDAEDYNAWLNSRGLTATLTLTACHPKYSAAERIIAFATLIGEPAPTTQKPRVASLGLGGEQASIWPAILLALLCALIWLVAWYVSKKWRKWPPYIVALPFFAVSLFYFFENFSRLLPSNY